MYQTGNHFLNQFFGTSHLILIGRPKDLLNSPYDFFGQKGSSDPSLFFTWRKGVSLKSIPPFSQKHPSPHNLSISGVYTDFLFPGHTLRISKPPWFIPSFLGSYAKNLSYPFPENHSRTLLTSPGFLSFFPVPHQWFFLYNFGRSTLSTDQKW